MLRGYPSPMPKDALPPAVRRALDDRVQAFDLRLFLAVLQRGSITAGAQAMSLSLAAASTRLKALEHQVGAVQRRA
jgi:molybdenum-dependent DNA-binding transcriptional regulator ModE